MDGNRITMLGTLETRAERYANEAHEAFTGNIIVPDDLQTIPLD